MPPVLDPGPCTRNPEPEILNPHSRTFNGPTFTEQASDLLRGNQQPKRCRGVVVRATTTAATGRSGGSFGDARINAEERYLRRGQRADAVLAARDDHHALVRPGEGASHHSCAGSYAA
jgi:hypothetical protein